MSTKNNRRAVTDTIGFKVGVYANQDDPDVWIEFDPEDIMELAAVQSNGCNMIILTLERGSHTTPFWEDYAEFFDAHVGMCASTDFLAAIQRLKAIKEQRFKAMRREQLASGGSPANHLFYDFTTEN